ncbi:MAG: hypothetical protein JO037_21215 [Actinobacteria bacterium]|nr:hypothetical protein [Actinomycetota bacterium]
MYDFENFSDEDEEWLSDLEQGDVDRDTELFDWPQARAREYADTGYGTKAGSRRINGRRSRNVRTGAVRTPQAWINGSDAEMTEDPDDGFYDQEAELEQDDEISPAVRTGPRPGWPDSRRRMPSAQARTQGLIDRGRRSAARRRPSRSRRTVLITAGLVALVTAVSLFVFRSRPSWPPSVATVEQAITTACQNADVASEPGQVNFACGKATSQILWIFALMTSNNNPRYADATSGRVGLEPITPTQGGEVAWSLNLHHPYNPYDPVDSVAVAARAINNIIGGATLTSANGKPAVQPGLESNPQDCQKYTGSPAVVAHAGFPSVCAQPVTSSAGQAALAADAYSRWVVGATAERANDVKILFENAGSPGNPQVQAILQKLPTSGS